MTVNREFHPASLSISCVIYDTPIDILNRTLSSLAIALNYAKEKNIIDSSELHLINNNPLAENYFFEIAKNHSTKFETLITHSGHGNIGYGRANNLAIYQTQKKYHLILNPDVECATDSIYEGILYLESHSDIGLVAPNAKNQHGEFEFLAKRDPSLLVILLRGFNSKFLNRIYKYKLDQYSYKDKLPTQEPFKIEVASGCFMLCRTSTLNLCGGFSSDYFLYFEDFDLAKKIGGISTMVYLPSLQITHVGGKAASKGIKHILLFLKSAYIFFKNWH